MFAVTSADRIGMIGAERRRQVDLLEMVVHRAMGR